MKLSTLPLLLVGLHAAAATTDPDFQTAEAGNPFVDGLYADPDNEFYDNQYWVYPTSSYAYDDQTYLDAFSSPDLINWTKHAKVLDVSDFSWAKRAVWAPAPIFRDGKYYLYFGANDIQSDAEHGGIGVGIADRPEGPYKDPLGGPLIGAYHNGAQPIDQDVFIDDDGQAYMYYGGHGHANVAKLNPDMISLGNFSDGTVFKEITPKNYVEGPQMMKRDGFYYLFWSEGGWGGPDYAVSYAMSGSPTGPFDRLAKILEQDTAVATGSGHNGIIHVPDTDIYYMLYHRHPLGDNIDANNRHLAYDRLVFNHNGTIQPVRMLVHDDFNDGNMLGWTTYGGSWDASSNALEVSFSDDAKALLNTNFTHLDYSADVTLAPSSNSHSSAGIIFRVSDMAVGKNAFDGYYAGISTSGTLVLGKTAKGSWTKLAEVNADIRSNESYRVRVAARNDFLSVSVGDLTGAQIHITDSTYSSGMDGVRAFHSNAVFDNVRLEHLMATS